jgi:CheY-like chemotaxis protein
MKERRGTILIVEDNPNEQILIKHTLEDIGVGETIQTVNDGADAIAYLKGRGIYSDRQRFGFPTFLLVDLKMREVHGLELLLFLKRSNLIIVPTIILTSSSDRADVKRAFQFGANAYHVKPVKMECLREQLKLIHSYWTQVELPDMDEHGRLLPSDDDGKLGEQGRHPVNFDSP